VTTIKEHFPDFNLEIRLFWHKEIMLCKKIKTVYGDCIIRGNLKIKIKDKGVS